MAPEGSGTGTGVRAGAGAEAFFLPDFCAIRAVFAVVVLAELLAFVLALVATTGLLRQLDDLALISLFIQWVALSCAAALCLARPWLARLRESFAGIAAYGLSLASVVLVTEVAWQVLQFIDPEARLVEATHGEFQFRSIAVGALVAAVSLRYLYVQHQWRRQVRAEADARLQALQARIRPHFFFNCMNTIASLTRSRPEAAERAVEDLADLFRVTLADGRELVPVAEELELCRKYLAIEGLRLGPRLRVVWDVDGLPPALRVPALTLQPLVENAVYHGVETLPQGGEIAIRGRLAGARVELDVTNPVPAPGGGGRAGHRIGQANVAQRLGAAFGAGAGFEVEEAGGRYRVRLWLPAPGQNA